MLSKFRQPKIIRLTPPCAAKTRVSESRVSHAPPAWLSSHPRFGFAFTRCYRQYKCFARFVFGSVIPN